MRRRFVTGVAPGLQNRETGLTVCGRFDSYASPPFSLPEILFPTSKALDVILGTAGHIDHGKTTLVRALTGINCDRLEEEKRRGITIELGFAWMDLPDGRRLGIVDVPGHERFIRNMTAGATGIDCVLMVIAADEGIMPQTREHLEICSLLGVRLGLVALTKSDLADPEWLKFVQDEVRNSLSGTFMAQAPIIPVSSTTGAGLEKLRAEIVKQLNSLPERSKTDIFRLPVDRVFSMKGFGTVATGTIISGACRQGDKLTLAPSGKSSRARSLQVHNVPASTAHEGQRCAINLQDLEVNEAQRGDILAHPGTLFPSKNWLARVICLKSSPLPIRQRMEVHFHHGSRECMSKLIFRNREALEPGESAIAEIKFESPMAAVYGDHFVLRAHSPLRTIGGGVVISSLPPVLIKRNADYEHRLDLLKKLGEPDKNDPAMLARKSPEELTEICLELCPAPGSNLNQLRVMTGLPEKSLLLALENLAGRDLALCWDEQNSFWISAKIMENCLDNTRKRAEELHKRDPLKSFFAQNELAASWGDKLPQKFIQAVFSLSIKRGLLAQDGSGLKLAGHKIKFDKSEARVLETLQKRIRDGGRTPPFLKEIIEEKGWNQKNIQPLLNYLCDSGKLLKLQDSVYYDTDEFAEIKTTIRYWFETNAELDIGDIKDILGISRKYAIPILEYLDASGMTYRVNNKRRLRKE